MKYDIPSVKEAYATIEKYNRMISYNGKIYDMGLKPDENDNPLFYILTDAGEHITIPVTNSDEVVSVLNYLDSLNTGVNVQFNDFKQFNDMIDNVFKVYCKKQSPEYYFDPTDLKRVMNDYGITGTSIARVSRLQGYPVGESTVYDLLEGITSHPRFMTIARIQKTLFKIVSIRTSEKQGH